MPAAPPRAEPPRPQTGSHLLDPPGVGRSLVGQPVVFGAGSDAHRAGSKPAGWGDRLRVLHAAGKSTLVAAVLPGEPLVGDPRRRSRLDVSLLTPGWHAAHGVVLIGHAEDGLSVLEPARAEPGRCCSWRWVPPWSAPTDGWRRWRG